MVAGMNRFKLFVLVALAGAAVAVLTAPAGARPRAAAAKSCSSSGLHYSYKKGSATYADKVEKLTVAGATCAQARSLAGTVAQDLLHHKKVPSQIGGWRPHVKNPCSGCSPVWKVTANGGAATSTFEVHGGTGGSKLPQSY